MSGLTKVLMPCVRTEQAARYIHVQLTLDQHVCYAWPAVQQGDLE